jgi:hypothetical protein
MEMDTPEQLLKEPTKHTRVRLAAPKKQLERTIQKMTKLSEAAMKPEKLVDLLIWMGRLQVRLLDMDRDEKGAKKDALIEENERLKSELAARPPNDPSDDAARRMLERLNSEHLKRVESEVATLKSQSATLQTQNAELLTSNSELRSADSELTQQVQNLQLRNLELQLTIKQLELRTPTELLAEAQAKMDMLKTS